MRKTEKVTLHFDFNHLDHLPADQEFNLKVLGKQIVLRRHTAETLEGFAEQNIALAAMPEEHRRRFTHFVEDIDLPADALGCHWVGYPSSRPEAACDEIAVAFQHVPSHHVRRAVRALQHDSSLTVPAMLAECGAAGVAHEHYEELHVHASLLINNIKTAIRIVTAHPEIGTFDPKQHHRIAEDIIAKQPSFRQLWQYLSTHPPEGNDPWFENTYVKDAEGRVMEPVIKDTGGKPIVDKNGKPVVWPTKQVDGKSARVIPQHNLSHGLAQAAKPVVQEVLRVLKDTHWLKGSHWSTQHGVTVEERTHVPADPPATLELLEMAATAAKGATADWTLVNRTSHYGLDLLDSQPTYDPKTKALSFRVKNWPNRGLGVHLRFLDPQNRTIPSPKDYLQLIGAGSVIFGVPVWAPKTEISFTMVDQASSVNILLGGLGHGHHDAHVDKEGLIYTCVVCYGIPAFLVGLSIGVQSTEFYQKFFIDPEIMGVMVLLGTAAFGSVLGIGFEVIGAEATLIKVSEFVAGIIFAKGLEILAVALSSYSTAEELIEAVPFVGWALKVASVASALADMTATSVEVGLSPATYTLEAKRSMRLKVIVAPDPTHGTSTQKPIWPKVSDHYVITVKYKGGTTLRKSGPMPGTEGAPIDVTFENATHDALPAAPGQKFQIIADIYSASNWIAGKWQSAWIEATPTDGDMRPVSGSIIERLVPLVPSTRYSHKEKLNYDGRTKKHIWEKTIFSVDSKLEPSLKAGPVAADVSAAFLSNGVRLAADAAVVVKKATEWQIVEQGSDNRYELVHTPISDLDGKAIGFELEVHNQAHPAPAETAADLERQDVHDLVDITINDLAYKVGYAYHAKNQNLPLDNDNEPQSSLMYLFQSISSLAHPEAGMKSPTRGFSGRPYIAYDQFGPTGLFEIHKVETTKYMPELDKGGAVPAEVSKLFTAAGFPLPEQAQASVTLASGWWQISVPGQKPLYDLRREVDVIKVFHSPVPKFSPNNFYLDTRTYKTDHVYHLRRIDLHDNSGPSFDYDSKKSWGAFTMPNLDAMAVHPNGYVIAISYEHHKMSILKLPATAMDDKDAPRALPFCGKGLREGLLRGPVGMTITADGRILVLEQDNARIQAFDTMANPVQCFASGTPFDLDPAKLEDDLNNAIASITLIQDLQQNVPVDNPDPAVQDKRYLASSVFSLDPSCVTLLDGGKFSSELRKQFEDHALKLGKEVDVLTTTKGQLWLVVDKETHATYDVRYKGEGVDEVDVYRGFTPSIAVKAHGAEWIIRDKTNTLSFDVKKRPVKKGSSQTVLHCVRLAALMRLKSGPSDDIVYQDVGVETKGFIYVLSHVKPGDKPSDYRLDIYNPDGTPVTPDKEAHNGQVNAARMTVDQWRTLFTLNYQQMEGPAGRPEPTVSQWIPSTPQEKSS